MGLPVPSAFTWWPCPVGPGRPCSRSISASRSSAASDAALRLLDELADDQALSLRAVAREAGIAATSVYIHFADRDALVLAALEHCHTDLLQTVDQAESGAADPVAALRARAALLGAWSRAHPGLYKVLHESTLNQRRDMSFKEEMAKRTTAAIQRCMDAGLAPRGDAETVSLDVRTAVHGAVSLRSTNPNCPGPRWRNRWTGS
jgi:AcrR family transcriptional regulator